MEYFMIGCLVLVGLFGLTLIVSTLCMGSNFLIPLQVVMGSLRYSKEIDDKLKLELGKVDANMCVVCVDDHTIDLHIPENDEYSPNYYRHKTPYLSIWIGNKFYSYGNIYRINGSSGSNYKTKRPSISVIKQLVQLQKTNGESTTKNKKSKEKEKTVILE